MATEALEVPELLRIIANNLPVPEQVPLLQVCKLWLNTLKPHIWQEVTLRPDGGIPERTPAPFLVYKNKSHVRTLNINYSKT